MPINVIFAASEAAPFAKTGGLADVAGSLPRALKKAGCEVSVFMPFYRAVEDGASGIEPAGIEVTVPVGARTLKGQVFKADSDGVTVYFVKRDEFFDRKHLYGTPEGDYFDNLERFVFFSRAVVEAARARSLQPDIIHCNDWQTGLIPAYLKDTYGSDLSFASTATIFTVHNIAYQGVFPAESFALTGLSPSLFTPEGVEFWGRLNLLKAGLKFSDRITTVSEAYSREIQTPEYGAGLEGVLKERSERLYGILNGVDYDEWDPASDPLIPANYTRDDLSGKAVCRKALLKEFGLKLRASTPVIGLVTRLAEQKGIDILVDAIPRLMELDLGIVILGNGDRAYQEMVKAAAAEYPKRVAVRIAFDRRLSHLVEAGSDIFLMPSRFEPCGLNQIYSMRYGTVPVVRATGGLDDTVRDRELEGGTGFKFMEYSSDALAGKVAEAVHTFKHDKKGWERLKRAGMAEEFSWDESARKYLRLYEQTLECLKIRHGGPKMTHADH